MLWTHTSATIITSCQAQCHGGHSGAVPPKSPLVPPERELCPLPPSEDCTPKKVTGSVPLECSSRSKTPKILVVIQEIVSKNCFFCRFCIKDPIFCGFTPEIMDISVFFEMKTFFGFLVFTPEIVEIRNKDLGFLVHSPEFEAVNFLCPPKFVYTPPVPLFWHRACIVIGFVSCILCIFLDS